MQSKTHIIFDMDGTLIDSSLLLANTINYVRDQIGLAAMDHDVITQAINETSHNPAQFFYGSEKFEQLHMKHFNDYYLQHHHKLIHLYDGIALLLENMSKTHQLSLATNADDVSTKPLLESLEIMHYFDIVVCANEVQKAKPAPMMIEKIIDFYGTDKKQFVMIGDGKRDRDAALHAGIDSLLVNWGFSTHQEAIVSVEKLAQVLGVSLKCSNY